MKKTSQLYQNVYILGSLDAKTITVNEQFTLPTPDGTSGQVLTTDGAGNVTWQGVGALSLTTDDVIEGSNLYYTNERAQDTVATMIQNGTGLNWTYNDPSNTFTGNVTLAPFTTSDLAEGSRLYYTGERVDDRVAQSLIQNGTGITWVYVDNGTGAGTLTPTISLSPFDTDDLSEGSTNLYDNKS